LKSRPQGFVPVGQSILTISELLGLTKIELLELRSFLKNQLAELPEGSSEWRDSFATLENIRAMLARDRVPPRGVAGLV
jgi:hypothetical protein